MHLIRNPGLAPELALFYESKGRQASDQVGGDDWAR